MSVNLNLTSILMEDPNLQEMYRTVQGNILKGHGRDNSLHIFIKFTGSPAKCREWLKNFGERITTAYLEHFNARDYHQTGTEHLFTGFFLSMTGYQFLEIPESQIPMDKAFRAGMKDLEIKYDTTPFGDHKPTSNPLHDVLSEWDEAFLGDIDALITLAHGGRGEKAEEARQILQEEFEKIQFELNAIAEVILPQWGHVLRNDDGNAIEHFGYADGVCNPLFFKYDLDRERVKGGFSRYDPSAPLSMVLEKDPGTGRDCFGSYFVYRKIQQNIKGFHDVKKGLAAALSEAAGREISPEMSGALMVGRFEDGSPVLEQPSPNHRNPSNNFNYAEDSEARRCPFQSHIRKTNPRDDRERQFGVVPATDRSRRIIRRGISYGSTNLDPTEEWTDDGLLFLCAQNDIERQFIFMYHDWCHNQDFVQPATGLDPLIGKVREGVEVIPQKWPISWGLRGSDPFHFTGERDVEFEVSNLVKTLGGEYFFAPSKSFFANL